MTIADFTPENTIYKEMPNEDNWLYFICGSQVNVWRFYDAPEKLRSLSDNGGNEDWVAICTIDFFMQRHGYMPCVIVTGKLFL